MTVCWVFVCNLVCKLMETRALSYLVSALLSHR